MRRLDIDAPNSPAVAHAAATVALVRDGADGIETWMMRRVTGMAFASGALVFPGGRVDPADADPSVPWFGPSPEEFADRLDIDVAEARSLVTAAVRELFEEAGILLSRPFLDLDLDAARTDVELRTMTLADLLAAHSGALDASLVRPWGRWVTPPTEPRRFDTWFFVAAFPQNGGDLTAGSEADAAGWMNVRQVLDSSARREIHVLPPTIVMLRGLLAAGTVSGVIAEATRRPMVAVHPEVRKNENGTISVFGGGEEVVVVL